MAEFKLDGRMKVKSLKANFKKEFGASLRVYTTVACKTPADDEKTLAALRAEGYKGGELVVVFLAVVVFFAVVVFLVVVVLAITI